MSIEVGRLRLRAAIAALVLAILLQCFSTTPLVQATDITPTLAEIMTNAGYKVKVLHFTTRDHYSLQVTRISNPYINDGEAPAEGRQPVLFIHGILTDSRCFALELINVTNVAADASELDVASMSDNQLKESLGKALRSLVSTVVNRGHIAYALNRRGTPGSRPDPQVPLARGAGSLAPNLTKRTSWLTKQDQQFASGTKQILDQLTNSSLNATSPANKGFLDELVVRTIESLPTPSQLLSSLLVDADGPFWDYSLDQQAEYDITGFVNFSLADSKEPSGKVSIVGHSIGSALSLMALIKHPKFSNFLHNLILWAPALYEGHGPTSSKLFEALELFIPLLTAYIGPIPPTTLFPFIQLIGVDLCSSPALRKSVCREADEILFGPTGGFQQELPEYLGALFLPISSHEFAQLLTSFKRGRMYAFDYGTLGNFAAYHQATPPLYDTRVIESRNITLWAGITDILVTREDVKAVLDNLEVPAYYHEFTQTGYCNHITFLIGDDIADRIILPSYKIFALPQIPT